ncbi:MAG: hypothetical protein HC896_18275 [Bacteroidales bacterium]|nr:hypothetical protein [Bacteroidales bacterium]
MKKFFRFTAVVTCFFIRPLSNGVVLMSDTTGFYLQLKQSFINVSINNQVAITTVSQTFYNQANTVVKAKLPFRCQRVPAPRNYGTG